MSNEIRIVIADDHPLVRKGLRMSIEEDNGLEIVAEAPNGEEALALAAKLKPDILVLDIDMPKMDGLGVAREVKKRNLGVKIIFLTLHTDQDMFRAAVELGSMGYILKDSAMEEIVACVRSVAEGRPYFSYAVREPVVEGRKAQNIVQENKWAEKLTPAERKIMKLIADGKTSKEIGEELSIHYRTVENHRTNICRKLSIEGEGPNALLRFALQNKSAL